MPENVRSFILFFDQNIFKLIPNLFQFEEDRSWCDLDLKLEQNGIKCSIFNNIGGILVLISFLVFFKILVLLTAKYYRIFEKPKLDTKIHDLENEAVIINVKKIENQGCLRALRTRFFKWISRINKNLDYAFYWRMFIALEIDLFLGSWATLKSINTKNIHIYYSLFFLAFCLINCLIYVIVIGRGFFDWFLPKGSKVY